MLDPPTTPRSLRPQNTMYELSLTEALPVAQEEGAAA
jgi:hypothetical protein